MKTVGMGANKPKKDKDAAEMEKLRLELEAVKAERDEALQAAAEMEKLRLEKK